MTDWNIEPNMAGDTADQSRLEQARIVSRSSRVPAIQRTGSANMPPFT
jgi:hypothetical protein